MSDKITTLTGGSEITVTKQDGTTEVVTVRQLAVKEFPKFQTLQDDEVEMCAFVCAKTKEWAESLSNESHEALIAEIEKVNGDFFSRWLARQLARQEKVMPGLREKLMQSLLASQRLSLKSPSSAA
jgi:hypothetical protein